MWPVIRALDLKSEGRGFTPRFDNFNLIQLQKHIIFFCKIFIGLLSVSISFICPSHVTVEPGCLSRCRSIFPSIYPSVRLSVCLSLSFYLPAFLSVLILLHTNHVLDSSLTSFQQVVYTVQDISQLIVLELLSRLHSDSSPWRQ